MRQARLRQAAGRTNLAHPGEAEGVCVGVWVKREKACVVAELYVNEDTYTPRRMNDATAILLSLHLVCM